MTTTGLAPTGSLLWVENRQIQMEAAPGRRLLPKSAVVRADSRI
jgi:hypothetical protein